MVRKAQSLDGTYENPNVFSSAEEIEEADYDKAVAAEENRRAAPGHKFPPISQLFPPLAACWLILLVVIPLHILFHIRVEFELKQLKTSNAALMEKNQNLTAELQVNKTQDLQAEKEKLTEQIKTMEKTWNEQKLSRAQQIIDEYCPKDTNNVRRCSSCQGGWTHNQSSCYAVNNASPAKQKTWEEAQENCRGKSSDLTVVDDGGEKKFVDGTSWTDSEINGYWVGLRAEEGKWKWIDGSDLTNQAWMQQQPAADGQCVTSLQNRGWKPVSCNDRNAWICEKKPLSV